MAAQAPELSAQERTWISFPWDTALAFLPPVRDGAA
jgi:hypothetical protein